MDDFVKLPPDERRIYFEGTAASRNMQAQILEKDFWVCWTLKELSRLPEIGDHLIFKGGTSLSKVFKVIQRFSLLFVTTFWIILRENSPIYAGLASFADRIFLMVV